MDSLEIVDDNSERLINNVLNQTSDDVPANGAQALVIPNTEDESILIDIAQINSDIAVLWKIYAMVTCVYPKRTFMNTHGSGEIASWDLTDASGSITLIAFSLNSYIMSNRLEKDKAYQFTNLSIRPSSENYKTLPHAFQLLCTNATRVENIDLPFLNRQIISNFTHLNDVNSLALNSIISVQVRVLRDYGISTGVKNENTWTRRDIHVDQDGVHLRMTLWNNQARLIERNMAGLKINMKHVKVSWFDGSRGVLSMDNTQMSVA